MILNDFSDKQLAEIHSRINNKGLGFDPSDEIETWEIISLASSTDKVSVYTDGENIFLVGTDATGNKESRWATKMSDDKE